jgi:hypothetical protein
MLYLTIALVSTFYGIDSNLATRIAKLESNFNPKAFSKTNDGGLFQLNTRYHRFHNLEWIFNEEINIHKAILTLSLLKDKCKHKINNQFILCYNMGIVGASKIKNPENQTYFKKTTLVWAN